MCPILFTWHGRRVPSYAAMLYLGLLAGTYTTYAGAWAEGLPGQAVAGAILVLLVPAVLGARLAFVVGRWRVFRRQPGRILARGEGGAVAYGALLAVPMSVPLLAALGVPFASFWDAGALGFLAAIVCLRMGCALSGCCCGRRTSSRFGLVLRNSAGVHSQRIPTQLLEAAWAAALLLIGMGAIGRMPSAGAVFLLLLGAYALGRFLLDFTREERRMLGVLTLVQWFSGVLIAVSFSAFGLMLAW
jgi:phosphatidylglycerol---prolipoprotein diacylglyceryl transferase